MTVAFPRQPLPEEAAGAVPLGERRPRYTARTARRQRTHQDIMEIAADLFYRRGIRPVTMDEVAASVGVTKVTLYKHFPSKDELVAACLVAVDQRHFDWFVTETEARAPDAAQQLFSLFDVLDLWFRSSVFRGCAFMNAAIELAESQHPAHRAIVAHKQRTRDWLRDVARRAGLAEHHADDLSASFMLLMEGAIVTAVVEGDGDAAKRARMTATHLVERHGIRERPGGQHRRRVRGGAGGGSARGG